MRITTKYSADDVNLDQMFGAGGIYEANKMLHGNLEGIAEGEKVLRTPRRRRDYDIKINFNENTVIELGLDSSGLRQK